MTKQADAKAEMRQRAWLVYVLAAVTTVVVYYAMQQKDVLFHVIGLSAAVLIVVALWMHRPSMKSPWVLFAVGQLFFVTGDVISYNYHHFFHHRLPYPAISDLFYLLVYPPLVVGILLMIRRRSAGRDRGTLVDSLMIAIGIATVSWVFLIAPYFKDATLTDGLLQKITAVAYPAMDLLLMSVAVRLAAGAGRKPRAFYLLMLGIVALFVTDALYGWALLHDGYKPGHGFLEAGWAAFYLLLGASALHPSMRSLTERVRESEAKVTGGRLALLATACLLAPAAQAVSAVRGEPVDLPVILGATITLFVLAVIRMGGLVRQQEQSARGERALRQAGEELVTATSREGIYAATTNACRTLAGERAAIRILSVTEDGQLEVVASEGAGQIESRTTSYKKIPAEKRARLEERRSYEVPGDRFALHEPLGLSTMGTVLVCPLFEREALHDLMIVAVAGSLPSTTAQTLEALATQVALALESAALTEDLLVRQSEARFASLVKNASDVVTVVEPDTTIRYTSPSTSRVLGYEPREMEGTRFTDLVHPDDKTRTLSFLTSVSDADELTGLLELRLRQRSGDFIFAEMLRTSLLHDPNVQGIVLNTRDVSERKAFEEQLSHQAFHDSVTGLANRVLFRDRVTHALERRDESPVAVLFMDLDDFKTINDSLGHAAGDVLLHEVGERLRACLRAADTAARLGGDEFAILLEEGGDGVQAADVADRIIQGLDDPFHLEGKEVFVRASIGIAIADGDVRANEDAVEDVLRNADVAMYMAKENGKGRYQMFEPAMHETALKRLELKADLQRALEHGEFRLHYQPVIELETGRVSGVEALIRWIHPDRGTVPPLDFIPLAEETGLIVPIGNWVLQEACAYAANLQNRFPADEPFHMAVNLSAKQLQRAEVVDEIRDVLGETGLPPASLILEITESVAMADMELSIARLGELKALGVQLAIDDFGTGYSSLNYVRRFPVDILKVDKSFIDGVSEGGESSALTAAMIELAGILNLKPVAEGIERLEQLERLLELRCALGQGYYFAKPLEAPALEEMLEERAMMETEAGLRNP